MKTDESPLDPLERFYYCRKARRGRYKGKWVLTTNIRTVGAYETFEEARVAGIEYYQNYLKRRGQ